MRDIIFQNVHCIIYALPNEGYYLKSKSNKYPKKGPFETLDLLTQKTGVKYW